MVPMVGLGFDLSARALDGLRDFIARESLAGRTRSIDSVVEGIIVQMLDEVESGGAVVAPRTEAPTPADLQRAVVERIKTVRPKQTRGLGEQAARAAHDENITYRQAAERFGVSYESVGAHYRRLYPDERRTTAGPSSRASTVPRNATEWEEALEKHRQERAELETRIAAPVTGELPAEVVSDLIGVAAGIRERIDALEVETKEWELIRAELDNRLARNRAELVLLRERLTAARKERAA